MSGSSPRPHFEEGYGPLQNDYSGVAAAAEAKDWDELARILQQGALALVQQHDGLEVMRRALESMPETIRDSYPGLAPHLAFSGLRPIDALDSRLTAKMLSGAGDLPTISVRALTLAVLTRRLNNSVPLSLELVEAFQTPVLEEASRIGSAAAPAASGFFAQAGKTHLLARRPDMAHTSFLLAWRWRHQDELGFVAHEAASNIAALHASAGRLEQAEEWLDHAALWPSPISPVFADAVRFAGPLARFIIAFERLETESATELLTQLALPTQGFEFFHWVAEMRVRFYLQSGKPHHAKQQLAESSDYLTKDQIIRFSAEASLLTGDLAEAVRLAGKIPDQASSHLVKARAHALRGDHLTALPVLEEGMRICSGRLALDFLALQAVCFLSTSQTEAARAAFSGLLDSLNGCIAALASIPANSLRALFALCASHPNAEKTESDWTSKAAEPLFGVALEQPPTAGAPLTRRELVVLGHLFDGLSRKQIAAIETVSINTIKTQIRTAFHKLGARSVHEAQVRTIELGLS